MTAIYLVELRPPGRRYWHLSREMWQRNQADTKVRTRQLIQSVRPMRTVTRKYEGLSSKMLRERTVINFKWAVNRYQAF
jgi:hypothetical protein